MELSVSGDADYSYPTGFEQYRFVHNALPEVDFDQVSTEVTLLGRSFSFPLFISSMTGGYADAGRVNTIIAEFCEKENLPFGVGSQRIMLEDPKAEESFSVVREKAPNAFIASNIGGAQLIGGLPGEYIDRLIQSISADAVIVHLNPLQELMQPEGDRDFKGIEEGISKLTQESPVPVIVKETGAGISADVAERLIERGVSVIDISGAGGTSWAKIENLRSKESADREIFNDWGIPTVASLRDVAGVKEKHSFELIASGGIRSSYDIVKAICMGADFTAAAGPIIKTIMKEGREGLDRWYQNRKYQVRVILTLLGCENFEQTGMKHLRTTV